MTIQNIIFNFKDKLQENHYLIDDEEYEFLKWFQQHIQYSSGVLTITDESLANETETTGVNASGVKLKNLIDKWFRTKKEKKEFWSELLKERLEYTNGSLYLDSKNNSFFNQKLTGEIQYITYANHKHVYLLEFQVTPGVTGQRYNLIGDYNIIKQYPIDTPGRFKVSFESSVKITMIQIEVEYYPKDHNETYSGVKGSVYLI